MKLLELLRNATITHISLCRRGKNGLRTVYKSAAEGGDGSLEVQTLVQKASAEAIDRGELLAVVYAPNRPDSDGDGMVASEIAKAAHGYLRDHRAVDFEHNGQAFTSKDAYVAESFIVAKGDVRFADWRDYDGNPVGDLTGAWATKIQLEHPVLRKAYRDGDLDGVSMFGTAAADRVAQKAASILNRLEGDSKKTNMNPDELKAILKAQSEANFAMFKELLTVSKSEGGTPPAPEGADPEPSVRPVLKGLPTPENLAKYEAELRTWEINEQISKGELSADQIAAMVADMTEAGPTDEEAEIEKSDTAEVKELKRRLFKASRASNTSSPVKKSEDDDGEASAEDLAEFGRSIGAMNDRPSAFQVLPATSAPK